MELLSITTVQTMETLLDTSLQERLATVVTALSTATIAIAPTAYTQRESADIQLSSLPHLSAGML